MIAYRLVFCGVTISLCSYWTYRFHLNENLITISYEKYYDNEKHAFPVLSMCFGNSVSEEILKKFNPNVNKSTYLGFLSGMTFDPKLFDIDYPEVIENISDYIEEDFIIYRNNSYRALHPDYFNNSHYYQFVTTKSEKQNLLSNYAFYTVAHMLYNCYELSIPPDRNIQLFWYRVRNSIFPSGTRPLRYGFLVIMHFKNQLLSAKTIRHAWPQHRCENDSYVMLFEAKIRNQNSKRIITIIKFQIAKDINLLV